MKIAIDIDDVIADSTVSMLEWHNVTYGTALKKEDVTTQDFAIAFQQSIPETIKRVGEWRNSPYFDSIKPMSDAQEVLGRLTQKHTLILVTSRFPDIDEKTKAWVQENFRGVFKEILFSKNHHVDNTRQQSKLEICQLQKADLFIDDVLAYVESCLAHCPGFLFDQPWNRNVELPEGVKRVYSWEEVEHLLS